MSVTALRRLTLVAVLLVGVHAMLAFRLFTGEHFWIFYGTVVEVAVYALAAFILVRDDALEPATTGQWVTLVVTVAVLLRLMLLFAYPVSTDIYRYIWDGRVQGAGINPYLYIPADPILAGLRDQRIYPYINRADYAPTIYPPLAQIVFFLVTRISGTVVAMKAAMVGFEIVAIVAILRLLKRLGLPANRILLYVWHPLPVFEFAGSGHVDAVALACVMLALLAADARRPLLAGMALGGATLVKFFPVVVGPALWRRWDWRLPAAGLATLILLYLPYLGAGKKVFGFLSAYSGEEGLRDGSGLYVWTLIRHIVPAIPTPAHIAYFPAAALVLLVLGVLIIFRPRSREGDIACAFVLAVSFIVLTTPHYPWYLAWLVPFLCFVPSAAVLYLTGSSTMLYIAGWPPDFIWYSAFYLPFFALAALEAVVRFNRSKERRLGHPVAAKAG